MTRFSSPDRGARVRQPAGRTAPNAHAQAPRQVRIIGGQWKRTPLPVSGAAGLRPTPDRVRETLFNWLASWDGPTMSGMACLDGFAGSGALGFEAASRGAGRVVMIERDARAAEQLRAIKTKLQAQMVQIVEADARKLMLSLPAAGFDVVFLDPPFDSALLSDALSNAARLTAPGGGIYVEAPFALDEGASDMTIQTAIHPGQVAVLASFATLQADGWYVSRYGKAGAVHYHLLRRDPEPLGGDAAAGSTE